MAKKNQTAEAQPIEKAKLPPPLPGGTETIGSLGRFIDNLLGDAKRRRMARAELDAVTDGWFSEALRKSASER